MSDIKIQPFVKDFDGVLSDRRQRIFTFLNTTPVGVLSSLTASGQAHGSVIYFEINKQLEVSFLTRSETRKFDNLLHNNQVMLTVFDPVGKTTATITGTAVPVNSDYEINVIAANMLNASWRSKNTGALPITKLDAGSYAAFRICPDQIRMAVYGRSAAGGNYSDIFETIESFDLGTS